MRLDTVASFDPWWHAKWKRSKGTYPHITRTWEKLSKPMKTRRHHPISSVECLFDAVAVMDIHVNVQDSRVDAQEFEDA